MKKLLLFLLLAIGLSGTALAAPAPVSEGVRIAVIDSGVSTSIVSPDSLLPGRDYSDSNGTQDVYGHGTQVTQLITGTADGLISGVCPSAKVVPMVTGAYIQGTYSDMWFNGIHASSAQAIRDAVDVYGCQIINCSYAGANFSQTELEAVEYAVAQGAIVVAGAGNEGGDALRYPGAYEPVLCVGACNMDGTLASLSQHHNQVDLLALGTNLLVEDLDGSVTLASGTSLSTPIVAGTLAQIWTDNPGLTAQQVTDRLLDSCRVIDGWRVLDTAVTLDPFWHQGALVLNKETAASSLRGFGDVSARSYCFDAVTWAVDKKITTGTGVGTFSPEDPCTVAQILTFLWRAAGSPASGTDSPDVPDDAWYADAAAWAWDQGLTEGTLFSGDAPCTRSMAVNYLWRLAGSPASGKADFADVPQSAPYAQAAAWAVDMGITTGTGADTFSPDSPCTRGQIMTFLYRNAAI